MINKTILIFGDSIVYGVWDPEGAGWVGMLRKYLEERTELDENQIFRVYNLGIRGDLSEDVLPRFETEAGARLEPDHEPVIIFAIGMNDSKLVDDKEPRTPPEKFKENLQILTRMAKKFTPMIVFLGLTPVDESKVAPAPWAPEYFYRNEAVKKFNGIIKEVAQEEGVLFIDIFDKLSTEDWRDLLDDGIHPNSKGHEKIFEIVKDFLTPHKII